MLIPSSKLAPQAHDFYALVFEAARVGCLRQLRGMGCTNEEAEEVFMDTILVVMGKVDPIARDFHRGQMVNLLKISSRRRLIDLRRHQGHVREVELDRADQLGDPSVAGPEESAERRRAAAIAREALLFLPGRDRLVYFLRCQMELTPTEVRQVVPGLSLRTYRKLIERSAPRARLAYERIESGERCCEIEGFGARSRDADENRLLRAHLTHCGHCRQAVGRRSSLAAQGPAA